eukprot:6192147-Pleurochrysis_carterae.AAC.8
MSVAAVLTCRPIMRTGNGRGQGKAGVQPLYSPTGALAIRPSCKVARPLACLWTGADAVELHGYHVGSMGAISV